MIAKTRLLLSYRDIHQCNVCIVENIKRIRFTEIQSIKVQTLEKIAYTIYLPTLPGQAETI